MKPVLALPAAALALLVSAACSTRVEIADSSAATTSGPGATTGAAAGGSSTTGAAAGGSAVGGSGTGGGVPSDVTGTMIYRYYGEGAPVDQPADLEGVQVEAFVWEGGSWTTYPGSGTAMGTFTIPGVPAGLFMVDVGGAYLYTAAHTLDLGAEIAGRVDAAYGSASNTVGGSLQNLDPWSSDDAVEWLAPNAAGGAYSFVGAGPGAGATSFAGQASVWYGALIDGSQKDVLYVTQLSQQPAPATLVMLTRFASFTGVEQKDGMPVTVTGAFTAVSPGESIGLDFRASQFSKLGGAVHPGASSFGATLELGTLPGAAVAGDFGYLCDLLDVYPDETDVQLPAVKYANPFPPSWGEILYAGQSWGVDYTAPGATSGQTQYGSVYRTMPAAQASAGPIVPAISPVQELSIDDQSALGDIAGIGVTPVLSWSLPAIGAPTAYHVTVYQLVASGGATSITYVAEIVTVTTSVPLPPALLQKGSSYVLVVTAVASPIDASVKPFHGSAVLASADVLTGVLQP